MFFLSVFTVMRVDILAMVLSFATASWLLFGCSDGDKKPGAAATGTPSATPSESPSVPGQEQPPGATLEVSGASFPGGIGTHCWDSTCRDMVGPVTGEDMVAVSPGEPLRVEFEEPGAAEYSFGWAPAPENVPPATNGQIAWSISPIEFTESADELAPTEPGRYLLSVFARWDGKGDVSYGWYVEVLEDLGLTEHPPVFLVTGAGRIPGNPGSYALKTRSGQLWADAIGIPTALDPSPAAAGAAYTIESSRGAPESLAVRWWTAPVEPPPIPHVGNESLYWWPEGGPLDIAAERTPSAPGRYLLQVTMHFADQSIRDFAWYLDVQ